MKITNDVVIDLVPGIIELHKDLIIDNTPYSDEITKDDIDHIQLCCRVIDVCRKVKFGSELDESEYKLFKQTVLIQLDLV